MIVESILDKSIIHRKNLDFDVCFSINCDRDSNNTLLPDFEFSFEILYEIHWFLPLKESFYFISATLNDVQMERFIRVDYNNTVGYMLDAFFEPIELNFFFKPHLFQHSAIFLKHIEYFFRVLRRIVGLPNNLNTHLCICKKIVSSPICAWFFEFPALLQKLCCFFRGVYSHDKSQKAMAKEISFPFALNWMKDSNWDISKRCWLLSMSFIWKRFDLIKDLLMKYRDVNSLGISSQTTLAVLYSIGFHDDVIDFLKVQFSALDSSNAFIYRLLEMSLFLWRKSDLSVKTIVDLNNVPLKTLDPHDVSFFKLCLRYCRPEPFKHCPYYSQFNEADFQQMFIKRDFNFFRIIQQDSNNFYDTRFDIQSLAIKYDWVDVVKLNAFQFQPLDKHIEATLNLFKDMSKRNKHPLESDVINFLFCSSLSTPIFHRIGFFSSLIQSAVLSMNDSVLTLFSQLWDVQAGRLNPSDIPFCKFTTQYICNAFPSPQDLQELFDNDSDLAI